MCCARDPYVADALLGRGSSNGGSACAVLTRAIALFNLPLEDLGDETTLRQRLETKDDFLRAARGTSAPQKDYLAKKESNAMTPRLRCQRLRNRMGIDRC